jgi:hypothetical protein
MESTFGRVRAIALFLAAVAFSAPASAAVTMLASFDGSAVYYGNGELVAGPDGAFYWVAWSGHQENLYRLALNGTISAVATIDHTHGDVDSLLSAQDGNFYGLTYGYTSFAPYDYGSALRIPLSGGTSTTLATFDGLTFAPHDLVQGVDGNFYGVAETGDANQLFQLTPSGKRAQVASFDSGGGAYGWATLIAGNDGNLYCAGHTGVFKFRMLAQPIGGNFTRIAPYPAGLGFTFPGPLAQDASGALIGMLSATGPDLLFKVTASGQFTKLLDLPDQAPVTDLVSGLDGLVYGSQYGSTYQLFVLDPTGKLSVIEQIPGPIHFQAADGSFYGIATTGGAYGQGGIFRVTLDRRVSVLAAEAQVLTTSPAQVHLQMKAVLQTAAPAQPLLGRAIKFSAGDGSVLCTAITDNTGTGKCGTPSTYLTNIQNRSYFASFAGDQTNRPAYAMAKMTQ